MLNQNTEKLFSLLSEYVFTHEKKDNIFDQVKTLLQQNIDINYKDKDGQGVLHLAASKGDARIIEALIEAGADVNSQDKYLETPINIAIVAGQTEIIKKLIEKNARPDHKNINGNNALQVALTLKNPEMINFLIQENLFTGANIQNIQEYLNCQNKEGKAPIHIASEFNKGEAIKLLLLAGVDSQLKTLNGEKALHLAAKNFSTDALIALNQEFIKDKDISCIEDYRVALSIIKNCRPSPSSLNSNDFRNSLEILQSVVNQYQEQEKAKIMSLEVTIECSGDNKEFQAGSFLFDEKEIANDGGPEAGSQYESPSTSPTPFSGENPSAPQAKTNYGL